MKYYRSYETYIKYYVDNIQKFYKNSFIIIVDNNSKYIEDIKDMFVNYNDLVITTNDDVCKFELGAYKIGINYLIKNDILDNYDYYVFTQDNFLIKNKYDFNILNEKQILACPINGWYNYNINERSDYLYHFKNLEISKNLISSLDLRNEDDLETFQICWCCSFILNKTKVLDFFNIVKDFVLTVRRESCDSERYLSIILYYLNNKKFYDIDGSIHELKNKYDCWNVNLYDDIKNVYFVKKVQQKNENTLD